MTSERIIELLLGNLGTLILALLIIGAFLKGMIVPGWAYRSMARERDRLFDIALPAVRATEHAAQTLAARNESEGLG